jgi:hypothetical protein
MPANIYSAHIYAVLYTISQPVIHFWVNPIFTTYKLYFYLKHIQINIMKSVKKELSSLNLVPSLKSRCKTLSFRKGIIILTILIAAVGCKKDVTQDRNYGYAKLTVECEKKCNVSFGTVDNMTAYDVDASMAVYYIRYQTQYNLDLNVTPVDVDQKITLNVYSREEKQIFHNESVRTANELWYSKILIP